MPEIFIQDSEFGLIKVCYNTRAKRLIFRVKDGVLQVTAPYKTEAKVIEESIQRKRTAIRGLFAKTTTNILREGDEIATRVVPIRIYSHNLSKLLFTLKDNTLNVFVPQSAEIETVSIQKRIKQGIITILRRVAEPYLHARLDALAKAKGVKYNKLTISTALTRMGSCSVKKDISLSVYLIFYPQHLVDYVMLHELAHLTEMNHSLRFHALCNNYCEGRERELEQEFKQFRIPL